MKILTFGVFDFFHIGHLRLFKQCRQYGDYLIVAVQSSEFIKKFKPEAQVMYSTDIRMELISSLREVDEVISYDVLNVDTLSGIDFDILALGEDHIGPRFDVLVDWCEQHGKHVARLKRTPGISSTDLKGKIQ